MYMDMDMETGKDMADSHRQQISATGIMGVLNNSTI